MKRNEYTLKSSNAYIYKWKPNNDIQRQKKTPIRTKKFYCTAVPFSLGEDWVCTYVYNQVVEDAVQKRLAYVACDYVQ